MDVIKIQIPALTENIRIVESFIDKEKENFKLNDEINGNIMIPYTETVNNPIVHENAQNKNKNFSLSLELNENS